MAEDAPLGPREAVAGTLPVQATNQFPNGAFQVLDHPDRRGLDDVRMRELLGLCTEMHRLPAVNDGLVKVRTAAAPHESLPEGLDVVARDDLDAAGRSSVTLHVVAASALSSDAKQPVASARVELFEPFVNPEELDNLSFGHINSHLCADEEGRYLYNIIFL